MTLGEISHLFFMCLNGFNSTFIKKNEKCFEWLRKIKKNNYKCAVKTIKTHEKKLRNLTKNVTLLFTDNEISL